MRSLPIAVMALALLAAGCGGPDTAPPPDRPLQRSMNPIVGGSTDNGHDAVALVYAQYVLNGSKAFVCTGTLIAPNAILTAGHCTLCGSGTPTYPGDPTCAASDYLICGGTDPLNLTGAGGCTWEQHVIAVHHPSNLIVNTGAGGDIEHDVAILTLDAAPSGVSPMPWQSSPDDAAYQAGTTITLVGYGADSDAGTNVGIKRQLTTTIAQEFTNGFSYGSTGSNTCEGDSGGPAISAGKVIGTTSYGSGGNVGDACGSISVDMRTDFESGFIDQYTGSSGSGSPHGGCKCELGDDVGAGEALLPALLAAGALTGAWRRRRRVS